MPVTRSEIQKLRSELVGIRRHVHQHPELGFKEFKTSAFIGSYLKRYGIEDRKVVGTGHIALIRGRNGSSGGKTVLFRADIDGLPVSEENRIPFASSHPGVMHA